MLAGKLPVAIVAIPVPELSATVAVPITVPGAVVYTSVNTAASAAP